MTSKRRSGRLEDRRHGWRGRRGAAMIEYVVVGSLYFSFVLGTIEFTWVSATRIRLANGCAKGAREAAAGDGLTYIRNAVRDGSGFNSTQLSDGYISIQWNSAEDASGTWSTVTDDTSSADPGTGTYLYNDVDYGKPIRVRVVNYPYTMVTGRALSWLAGATNGTLPLTTSIMMLRRE